MSLQKKVTTILSFSWWKFFKQNTISVKIKIFLCQVQYKSQCLTRSIQMFYIDVFLMKRSCISVKYIWSQKRFHLFSSPYVSPYILDSFLCRCPPSVPSSFQTPLSFLWCVFFFFPIYKIFLTNLIKQAFVFKLHDWEIPEAALMEA